MDDPTLLRMPLMAPPRKSRAMRRKYYHTGAA